MQMAVTSLLGLMMAAAVTCSALPQSRVVFGKSADQSTCDNCVTLMHCPALKPVPGVRLTYEQAAEIRRRKCGYSGVNIKVCCPDAVAPPDEGTEGEDQPTNGGEDLPIPTELPLRCGDSIVFDRIYRGTDAPLGANPWMVALGYSVPVGGGRSTSVVFQCGGSLITRQHVVTAAHCVHPQSIGFTSLVQLNIREWNTETDPDCTTSGKSKSCAPPVIVRQPAATTWHPEYNTNGKYNNDVAVIRLDKSVEFGIFVQPICIPITFDPTLRRTSSQHPLALATGWGATENRASSAILQEIRLPFVSLDRCNESYTGILNENQVCAGGVEGEDSCVGDSGGPLITTGAFGPPYQLVGLTSFGRSLCGGKDNYGVYTAVYKYRDWIVKTLPL